MLGSVVAMPTDSVGDRIMEIEKKLALAKKVLTAKNLGHRNIDIPPVYQFYHVGKSRMGPIAG